MDAKSFVTLGPECDSASLMVETNFTEILTILQPSTFSTTFLWRHDTQHNDAQHNDIQHNDSQHKELLCDAQHK
jgi:hypothetical protein